MLRIWLPEYYQIVSQEKKTFTVYQINVTTESGRYFSLAKRYSSFYNLYMKCRDKYFLNIAFPPKKLSNTSSKILESRREDLEKYLQCLAKIYPLPIELIEFLELENFSGSENSPNESFETPVYKTITENSEEENDLITQTTLDAFYEFA